MRDEKYLHQFLILAQEQSFSMACLKLHLSQSALTKNIRKIEDRLNVKLFDRTPKGVILTESGKILEEHVQKMEEEYYFAIQKLKAINGVKRQKLRIGAGQIWGAILLPKVLDQFHKYCPEVNIEVTSGDIVSLLPCLHTGKLDIVLGRTDYKYEMSSKLDKQPLINVDHIIVASKNHPLAGKKEVSPADIAEYDWLLYKQNNDFTTYIDNYFHNLSLPTPNFTMNSEYFDCSVSIVRQSDYLMAIPSQFLDKLTAEGLVKLDLQKPLWGFPSGIWTHKSSKEIREINTFTETVKEMIV